MAQQPQQKSLQGKSAFSTSSLCIAASIDTTQSSRRCCNLESGAVRTQWFLHGPHAAADVCGRGRHGVGRSARRNKCAPCQAPICCVFGKTPCRRSSAPAKKSGL